MELEESRDRGYEEGRGEESERGGKRREGKGGKGERTLRSWKAAVLTFRFSSRRSTTSRYDHPTS